MTASSVAPHQRHTRSHPCRVCGGYDTMPRHKEKRCYGFDSEDGRYIHCTREQYGGRPWRDGTYVHMTDGPCECGHTHGALARPRPASASSSPRVKKRGRVLAFPASTSPSSPNSTPESSAAGEWIVLWKQPQAEWLYRDAAGMPVYKVTRYPTVNAATGERDKTYLPSRPPRGGRGRWPAGLDGVTCIPYRLPELLAADPAAPVYLCEGEKCADALAAAGVLATATQGGAMAWAKTAPAAGEALRGRHVVILPDRDAPGARYALDAAASLHDVAASVRIVELPDLTEPGADVADWLAAGGTAERLAQLAAAAPAWAPASDPVEGSAPPLARPGRGAGHPRDPGDPGGPQMAPPAPLPALVELHPIRGLWCDRERTQLYRVSRGTGRAGGRGKGDPGEDDAGEDDGPTLEPVRLLAGMPRLLSVSTVGGDSDGDPTEQTVWRWEWSNLPECGPISASEKDLNSGAVHAKTPGVAITARADRDMWADVIKAQVIAFRVPVGVARQHTGWHQDEKTGLWERHLRDGRCVQRPDAAPVPIAGLRFGGAHRDAWESDMRELPAEAPSPEQLRELLAFVERVDPLGRLLAQMGAAARASVATFVPAGTVVLPTGQTRAGKTTTAQFARGFDGPCPPKARADCVFTGTIPGLAAALAPLHDEYLLVDDFHLKDTDVQTDVSKLGNQLDMLITGGADGNDMRPRATQTGKRRQEMIVTGMLCLTGEGLPATTESRFLRSTLLPYKRGELAYQELLTHWAEYQRIWWTAGHAVFRWEGERVNDDLPAFRRDVEQREAAYKARILAHLRAERPAMDVEELDTLASNYARPALGLWLVDRACGTDAHAHGELGEDGPMVAAVWAHLLRLAVMQAQAVELGGPGQASRDWIVNALRGLAADGRGHGLDMANKPLEDMGVPGSLTDWGYQGTWPRGEHLFNYDASAGARPGMTYWRTERLCAALAERAGRARPQPVPWKWSAETLPAYLVRLGIAIPQSDAEGNLRRNVQSPYVANKRTRRLAIPAELFIGEAVEDGDPDDNDPITSPIENSENSGTSGTSGTNVPRSLKISDMGHGTAWYRSENDSGTSGTIPPDSYYADADAGAIVEAGDPTPRAALDVGRKRAPTVRRDSDHERIDL